MRPLRFGNLNKATVAIIMVEVIREIEVVGDVQIRVAIMVVVPPDR